MSTPSENVAAPAAKQTTITALKPTPEEPIHRLPVVHAGFNSLQAFELIQRGAKLLAASSLVPKEFQGNLPNCTIALEIAQRLGASALMVMQNLYVVYGRPGWSAKFLIATFNQCGRFSSIKYVFVGTRGKDDWGCIATTTELATGERIEGPLITIELAKKEGWYSKSGSKWQTIPEKMLRYRSAAWMIDTTAPEISMGLKTADELGDIYDATNLGDGKFAVTTDSLREALNGVSTPPLPGAGTEPDATPQTQQGGGTNPGGDLLDTYVPHYDEKKAIDEIKKCKSEATLNEIKKNIEADYDKSGRGAVPVAIDAAINDRREWIKQQV